MSAEFATAIALVFGLVAGFALGSALARTWLDDRRKASLPIDAKGEAFESISERYERQTKEVQEEYWNRDKVERLRKDWPIGRPVYLASNGAGPCMAVVNHTADMTSVAGGMTGPGVCVAWINLGLPVTAWYPPDALVGWPGEQE